MVDMFRKVERVDVFMKIEKEVKGGCVQESRQG